MSQEATAPLATIYDKAFYADQVEGSSRSASTIVPMVLEFFPRTSSVIDLGCGTGVWLHHFKAAGVPRVLGIDGGNPGNGMLLEREEFYSRNLAEAVNLPERFDISMSLEVAEHLPPSAAAVFVASLCALSDIVVFGAAIPGQGGTWHINERWQSYWASLFDLEGYELFDVLRPKTWYDQRVEWWYAQNTVIYARRTNSDVVKRLSGEVAQQKEVKQVDLVHPRCFEAYRRTVDAQQQRMTFLEAINQVAQASHDAQVQEIARLAAAARRAAVLFADAQAGQAAASARIHALLSSTSWRLTGPMRRLSSPFPKVRAAVRGGLAPFWRIARSISRAVSPRDRIS